MRWGLLKADRVATEETLRHCSCAWDCNMTLGTTPYATNCEADTAGCVKQVYHRLLFYHLSLCLILPMSRLRTPAPTFLECKGTCLVPTVLNEDMFIFFTFMTARRNTRARSRHATFACIGMVDRASYVSVRSDFYRCIQYELKTVRTGELKPFQEVIYALRDILD